MKKDQKSMLVLGIVTAFTFTFLFLPGLGHARGRKHHVPPWSMMKTLDQIPPTWSQILDASDGKKGDVCNSSRFECVMGGDAVLDKETGLVWERYPDNFTVEDWYVASRLSYRLEVANRKGWRLPTIEELASLVDNDNSPALPAGHPFNVQVGQYWSSTTDTELADYAWIVNFSGGGMTRVDKESKNYHVWCVRGGPGYDAY